MMHDVIMLAVFILYNYFHTDHYFVPMNILLTSHNLYTTAHTYAQCYCSTDIRIYMVHVGT